MDLPILYEDSAIVVIDKPCGVVVNRAETVREETIQDWHVGRYPSVFAVRDSYSSDDEQYFVERGGIVHRLDRETSGVMVLAKTCASFITLLAAFKNRDVHKDYVALTHGIWKEKHGDITATVGRMRHNRKMMGVREDGRDSVTQYRVEREYTSWHFSQELAVDDRGYTGFSFVQFSPKTGRTHQIRVHARHMGHPIVGDPVYAGRKRSREDRTWAGRILLHAAKLTLPHPTTGERKVFVSPHPFDEIMRYFVLA